MDLLTLLRIAFRRWYVALPVMFAALALALTAQASTAPQFQSVGSVLLEEPTLDSARLPRSLVSIDDLVARLNEGEAAVAPAGSGIEVVAQAVDRSNIEITALGPEAAATEQAIEASVEWIRQRVMDLQEQEDVPEGERLQATLDSAFPIAEEQPDGTSLATATIRLSDPGAGLENPLGAGQRTSRMLEAVIMSDVGRARVSEHTGGMVGYTVAVAENENSILEIITVAPDPANALAGFAIVRDELNQELDARQARAGVPPSWRIEVNDLAPPQSAGDISPPVTRSAVGIVAAGLLLAVALTVVVDSVLAGRGDLSRKTRDRRTAPFGPGSGGTSRSGHDQARNGSIVVPSHARPQSPPEDAVSGQAPGGAPRPEAKAGTASRKR
jgi:hypothetical protein